MMRQWDTRLPDIAMGKNLPARLAPAGNGELCTAYCTRGCWGSNALTPFEASAHRQLSSRNCSKTEEWSYGSASPRSTWRTPCQHCCVDAHEVFGAIDGQRAELAPVNGSKCKAWALTLQTSLIGTRLINLLFCGPSVSTNGCSVRRTS